MNAWYTCHNRFCVETIQDWRFLIKLIKSFFFLIFLHKKKLIASNYFVNSEFTQYLKRSVLGVASCPETICSRKVNSLDYFINSTESFILQNCSIKLVSWSHEILSLGRTAFPAKSFPGSQKIQLFNVLVELRK